MTLDEVLGRVTIPEDKAFLQKMISDQNSYITKLETQLKDTSKQPTESAPAGVDKVTYAYLEKKMKEDVISSAEKQIKATISEQMFNAVEKDWHEFLDANMTIKVTTVEYATDAFNLVLGRCLAKKDHPVNQLGKGTTPNPTPVTQPTAGTNTQGVQDVNNIIRQTPPTMSNNDVNAQSGIPTPQANQIKNTKDSFAGLRARLSGQGGNPFQ